MANILTLICVILLFAFLANPARSQRDGFYFDSFSGTNSSSWLSLNGVAEVEKNGMIRLTNDTRRLLGHAFYPNPIRFKRSPNGKAFSFSTTFAFAIVPEYPKLGGHGMAFVIANSKELTGALPSQYLGLLNATDDGNSTNHIFAVEFDTVQDFEFGDIDDNHVGIDINSLTSNASASAASGPEALNLKSGKTIAAWIDYDSVTNLLNVSISSLSTKPVSPVLSHKVDLSPILQETMFAGFSASTGLLASSHYLFGWSFKMNGQARPLQLSSLPSLPRPKRSHTDLVLGLSISTTLFIIFAVAAVIYLIWKIKNADFIEAWEFNVGPHRFSYKELKKATKNFRDKELLGSGGFGKVYKGVLPKSKIQVAVKRIAHESRQGLREFASEIAIMGRLRHRNLVQLLGWGRRRGDLLLVYDYMPNGSLDKYIYEDHKDDVHLLSWEQRFKVIKHVASGLLYLHEEWEQTVIHRDVKAGNVLLDSEMNGRLGDFGLAKLYEHGANPSTTRVVGTLGYLAPELTKTGKPTTGSDVFAFGALLLEVVCGRRPVDPKRAAEEVILVDWVWGKWEEGAILDVVDRRLRGEFDEAEAALVLKLGLMCSNDAGVGRPSMRQVVRYLEGEAALPEVLEAPAVTKGASGGFQFEDFVHSYNDSVTYEKMTDLGASGFSLSGSVDGGGR